jgi:hypothetical protein
MRPRPALALIAALATAALCSCSSLGRPHPLELWFYEDANLKEDDAVAKIEPIWRRAAVAGYTKVILADAKLSRPAEQTERYRANCELLTRLAGILHLEIVPDMFSVGRGNGAMLAIDPNLAEALPVRDARFVVHGEVASLVPDPPVALASVPDKIERAVRLGDRLATAQDVRGTARMTWNVKVSPFRCYHVAVKVRTMEFSGEPVLRVFSGRRRLDFTSFRVRPTQDWTDQSIMFNSLASPGVKIVIGVVHGGRGIVQWKDWRIEEVGPVNLVRRAGAPLAIRDERTGRPLIEGRDFAPLVDSLMGNSPWRGQYDNWHRPPTLRVRGLSDGTALRVSWCHAGVVGKGQASVCLSDTAVARRLAEEAANTRALFGARTALMGISEQRVVGWDSSCAARGRTAAQILGDHLRADVALLQGMNVCVWNDMFDPKQNAVPGYYLVNGDLTGSWEGLDSSVTVINWNGVHRAESLRFFAKRGNRQVIAAYYDGSPSDVRHDLDAARGVPGVTGVMYTTWRGHYKDLEAFAEEVLRAGWR